MPFRAKLPFRIAAGVFLLFAVGHTAGFPNFRPSSAEALAVLDGMRRVQFNFGGSIATWRGLFDGFGYSATFSLLFSAALSWRLGNAGEGERALARTIAWMLAGVQAASIVICLIYFGPTQAVFSAVCGGCLVWAALRS